MTEAPILLVEDNPDDAELTLRALKKNKIFNEVVLARDGEEALEYLFPEGGQKRMPAVVLLDLKMPRMDGLEVLRWIRADENTRLLPVVILTTSKEQEGRINSYDAGCNSYIRKPVDFDDFVTIVHRLGEYWLVLNEGPPV
jgi:CheY-like chemotaxis protein